MSVGFLQDKESLATPTFSRLSLMALGVPGREVKQAISPLYHNEESTRTGCRRLGWAEVG